MTAAIAAVEAPSRALPGVVHFDVARSLIDPAHLRPHHVFQDRRALERQNTQSDVGRVLSLVAAGAPTGDLQWTVWEASNDSE